MIAASIVMMMAQQIPPLFPPWQPSSKRRHLWSRVPDQRSLRSLVRDDGGGCVAVALMDEEQQ